MGVSDESTFLTPLYMWKYGAWVQDDWRIGGRLTVNLGLRYDLIWNAFAQCVDFHHSRCPIGRRTPTTSSHDSASRISSPIGRSFAAAQGSTTTTS